MITDTQRIWLTRAGFIRLTEKPVRGVVGIKRMMFTYALCYGVEDNEWQMFDGRYCYKSLVECVKDMLLWTGEGDPPGQWIKHKGATEYSNPRLIDE